MNSSPIGCTNASRARENREETIRLVMDHLKLDRATAEESYALAKDAYSSDGSMSDEGF
jgi:hypothetical protein